MTGWYCFVNLSRNSNRRVIVCNFTQLYLKHIYTPWMLSQIFSFANSSFFVNAVIFAEIASPLYIIEFIFLTRNLEQQWYTLSNETGAWDDCDCKWFSRPVDISFTQQLDCFISLKQWNSCQIISSGLRLCSFITGAWYGFDIKYVIQSRFYTHIFPTGAAFKCKIGGHHLELYLWQINISQPCILHYLLSLMQW